MCTFLGNLSSFSSSMPFASRLTSAKPSWISRYTFLSQYEPMSLRLSSYMLLSSERYAMANPSFSLNFSRLISSFIVSMDSAFVSFPVKISSLVLPNLYGKFLRVSIEIDLRAVVTS